MSVKILAIETSCDETAVAVVENGNKVLVNEVLSQIDIHKEFGGVVPEVASRYHMEGIIPLIEKALKGSGLTLEDVDAVAVTNGPGLIGALLVGVSAAKALAFSLNKPLIAVNHLSGHIYANFIDNEVEFPLVTLIVSGGHTDLIYMDGHLNYEILGQTRDDAAGEAFDKIARAMNLGYPGGPIVDNMAKNGEDSIKFPRVHLEKGSYDFSFSGLKSAVINHLHNQKQKGLEINVEDVCASFQQAVVDVLVDKTIECAKHKKVKNVLMAGGVSANSALRELMSQRCQKEKLNLYYPPLKYCTDNAAMIGAVAFHQFIAQDFAPLDLNAYSSMSLND
ncbi:tRNA (adenosine(37)-N6)-threonylcarbamoyltransferase complex transferase subunit TsaD [Proteinivorax hydrogeniformans]|uniref:tRNA N6-adenosine threonylcarbamoyltransferase n=1 Tax=Proteinivorax hydrogeniformans TaxID=1826727 RepID=A0AAU8HSB8_9FIRM